MTEATYAARADRNPTRAGQAAVSDDSNVDTSGGDGRERVGKMELERPASDRGVIDVPGVHIQVIGQIHAAVADTAGRRKQAVHVVFGETGVGQGLDYALALNLQLAFVGSVSG